jgi:hypothetical protein
MQFVAIRAYPPGPLHVQIDVSLCTNGVEWAQWISVLFAQGDFPTEVGLIRGIRMWKVMRLQPESPSSVALLVYVSRREWQSARRSCPQARS